MSNRGRLKFICPNKSCINKSIVYRSANSLSDFTCKACNSLLKITNRSLSDKRFITAKKELAHIQKEWK